EYSRKDSVWKSVGATQGIQQREGRNKQPVCSSKSETKGNFVSVEKKTETIGKFVSVKSETKFFVSVQFCAKGSFGLRNTKGRTCSLVYKGKDSSKIRRL
nr:hypothetical protein [Tanacetum cinerariifolium]